MSVDQPFNIYREQLSSLYHGLALWDPKPVENLHKQPGHVSIGDVGYLENGGFMRMFNVTLPWDDPSNKLLGKPEKYERIKSTHLGKVRDNEIHDGEYYTPHNVSIVDNVRANTHEDAMGQMYQRGAQHHGALLSLPHKGHRKDVISIKVFEEYIKDNVDNWFRWSRKMKLPVEQMEDLILVTGCTMVTSWAAAAFDGHTSMDSHPTTISLETRKFDGGRAQFIWRNRRGNVDFHNSGFDPDVQKSLPQNQCIFIRGFRAKRSFFRTKPMRAEAEPLPDDPDNCRQDEIQVTQIPNSSKYRDPLVGILDYIIQLKKYNEDNSAAEDIIAIAHDDDLRLIEGVETLTADAIEKFLLEKQMPLMIVNGSAILRDPADNEPPVSHEKKKGWFKRLIHLCRSTPKMQLKSPRPANPPVPLPPILQHKSEDALASSSQPRTLMTPVPKSMHHSGVSSKNSTSRRRVVSAPSQPLAHESFVSSSPHPMRRAVSGSRRRRNSFSDSVVLRGRDGSSNLHGHSVAQFLQIGYVTPGSSRSNSSSTSYPQAGPVHGTPFPPSPLVPSPPRSKTSDDLPSKSPAAWQAGDSASASGSSTCVGSNSSATLYPQAGPVHGTPFVPSPLVPSPPRSKTFDDLPSKPPAAQTKAWKAGVSASAKGSSTRVDPELTFSPFPHDFTDGPEPTSLRSRARAPRFHMHPVLSYTRLHHAPISFDVAFTPSARTVVDRTVHSPFLAVTLAQPATEPPIPASSRLVLRSPILPWVVVVGPIGSPLSFVRGKDGEKRKAKSSAALTILDVLYAVHFTLMNPVTPEEWHSLGEGSRAQRRVAEAYKERCTRMGGGWEGGVRRVDWLGSKTHLVGVEIDRSNEGENVGKLVFGRPSSGRGLTAAVPARAASAAKP